MPSFAQIISAVKAWDSGLLPAFSYSHDGIDITEFPMSKTKCFGPLHAVAANKRKIVLIFCRSSDKHVFVTFRNELWNHGTVTFCWAETGLLRTFVWDHTRRMLRPSISRPSDLDDAAMAVEGFLRVI